MNERIWKLAEQSGCKVMDGEWYIPSATGLEKIVYTKGIGLEKFAELIVRECIAICQDIDGEDNIDARSGRQDCAVEIREHFGVEE
jgi:hypothetical protein